MMILAARRRIYEILELRAPNDRTAAVVNYLLVAIILANVIAVVLESESTIHRDYAGWLRSFGVISLAIFTLEYLLRVWVAVECDHGRYRRPVVGRLRYMVTPLALIDLAAILPFYLGILGQIDLRFMRVFRLLLVFKLTRYDASMQLLGRVLRQEARPIAAAMFVLAMLLVITASFAYLAEHRVQPEAFGSIPKAMYWSIITMTTVGYGDVVPITPFGKFLGAMVGVIGIGMVALPAGLLASGFSEQLHERRREFEAAVDRVLENGVITPEEGDRLKEIRDQLGLTDHQAAEIVRLIARRGACVTCPHCGEAVLYADGRLIEQPPAKARRKPVPQPGE